MTETTTPPTRSSEPASDDTDAKQSALGLSLPQVVGGSAAAATAALLGSRLGTTGTIVGAALASIVTAIAGALYTASLARTRRVVEATKELLPGTMTLKLRIERDPEQAVDEAVEQAVDEAEEQVPAPWHRIAWKPVAVAAALVFVIGALVITGVEVVTGRSLDGSSRTTFDHVVHDGRQPSSDTTPVPSPTPSSGATGGASQQKTPSSGSSATSDPGQAESTSPSASPSASATPTRDPSASASATATPSTSPTP